METPHDKKKPQRAPRWLRILLMILLILFVCVAFYLNYIDVIKGIRQK